MSQLVEELAAEEVVGISERSSSGSFNSSAPWRVYVRAGGASDELTRLALAAMWARPYDRLGMDPGFFH